MALKIGIISLKGGVGKTTTVASLGACLANDFNKKVLMVDANFSAPNLALHFGIINPETTIHHVFSNKSHIKHAITTTAHKIDILPGSLMGSYKDCFLLKKKLDDVEREYDIILIDSSPNLNQEILATMVASDELYVVTTPDFPTLSCTMKAIKIAKKKKTPIKGIIINKAYNKRFELTIKEIEEGAECKVLAVIPHDVTILEALSKTIPHPIHRKNCDATMEIRKLAAFMVKEVYKDTRFGSMLKRTFSNGLPHQDRNKAELLDEINKFNQIVK